LGDLIAVLSPDKNTRQAGGGKRETTDHDGLLHDFVLVPVGVAAIPKADSTDPVIKAGKIGYFGIEPEPMALLCRTAPFHPAAHPTKC
jgi:hypothetical protein